MCIDEQEIQSQLPDQFLESIIESSDIVSLAENPGNFAGLQARWNQEQFRAVRIASNIADTFRCYIKSSLFNPTLVPKIIIERVGHLTIFHPEQYMNSRGLNVGINDSNAKASLCRQHSDVGCRI